MNKNDSLNKLRESIKEQLSEKRYIHTLGVEKMALKLGEVLLPDKLFELSVAALLHDIAKEITYEEQLKLLNESKYPCSKEDIDSKSTLHSLAAVPVIKRNYVQFSTDDVISAVSNHTLGSPNMSIFDEIIFISDYAEEGRTYNTCIEVNRFLREKLHKENLYMDNIKILHEASLMSIRSTIDSLVKRREKIHSKTMLTKEYLESII